MRKGTGSISTPTPRAPKSFAAAITMRPSPQPRSYTTSPGPAPASLSIPSTASSVLGKYGTSGSKTGATPSVSEVSPPSSSAAQPETSAAARTIVRDSSLRTGPPPSKQHDDGSRRQHADADERDRGLEDIGVARCAARAVPAGEKGKKRPFPSERKVRARADDDGRVDRSERGDRDDQADQPRAVFAPDAREEVGSDDV